MVRAAPADITRRSARHRRRVDAPVRRDHAGHDPRLPVDAAAGDGADPRDHLQRGHRDPLPERDVGEPDVAPLVDRPHDARALAWQADSCGVPEPEPPERFGEGVTPEAARDLGGADVARELEHLGDGQHAVSVRVVDRVLADHHLAHQAVEAVVRLHHARVERRGDGERLHGRARLVGVGDGPVAGLRLGGADRLVRVERRHRRHRQHLARARVHHDRHGALGMVLGGAGRQRALGDERQVAVDGQHGVVAAGAGRIHRPFDRDVASESVPHPLHRRRRPAQLLVQGQLDAVEPTAFGAGVPHHRRRQAAVRVEAARLAGERHPRQPQRLDRLGLLGGHLALHPGEEPALLELLLQLGSVHPENARQLPRRFAGIGELPRVAVDRIDVRGRCQIGAVAVEDPPAPRGQLDLTQVLLLGHRPQPIGVANLQVDGALADGEEERRQHHATNGDPDARPAARGDQHRRPTLRQPGVMEARPRVRA